MMQTTIGTISGLGTKHQSAASWKQKTHVKHLIAVTLLLTHPQCISVQYDCRPSRPSNACGWVGKFVSFSPNGVSEDDIRFQDIWLRTFQEVDVDGKFRLKMIRKADQAAKSWPRSGALQRCQHIRWQEALVQHSL